MQITAKMFLLIMIMSFAVATEVNAFVTGAWDVVGTQHITVKMKGSKKEKVTYPSVSDQFVFSPDGDFSALNLEGVGAWAQKRKTFKVKVDAPDVMETFFEDEFEKGVNPLTADVTVQSFSISGSQSNGRIKGSMSFKLRIDLLNGYYAYLWTTYKFIGSPAPETASRGVSRTEEGGGLSELITAVLKEAAPELAAAARN